MARLIAHWSIGILALIAVLFEPVEGIKCYRCSNINNTHPFQCNEFLTEDFDLEPQSCDDVFGAQYCIKHVGRYEASALDCYQCASATEWTCERTELLMIDKPQNCDHVFEARYCIKTVGRYAGGIGTKRFCSSKHLGNYCDYVNQPGDKLQYRTCVYTCSTDGCNPASTIGSSKISIFFITLLSVFIFLHQR